MGFIQEEWLVYFHSKGTERYAKWIWWWKPPHGFSHCGALKYIEHLDAWEHLEFTHAGIRTSILDKEESKNFFSYLYDYEILICPVKNDWHLVICMTMKYLYAQLKMIGICLELKN